MPSPPHPPSARDFLAYQRLVIDQASTRTVAGELKISQTRVRQVVRRVTDWLLQNLPPTDQNDQAALLRLAQHIAADRLDRYLREADEAWRQTMETRYAGLTLRLLLAQSKFPALSGNLEALAMDAILGRLPDDSMVGPAGEAGAGPPTQQPELPTKPPITPQSAIRNSQSAIPPPPPPRDCSPSPQKTPSTSTANNTATVLTPPSTTPSENEPTATNTAAQRIFRPCSPRQ